jgi:hypothetical protein
VAGFPLSVLARLTRAREQLESPHLLKELAPLAICAKIDDEFILWMVLVSEDRESRLFHTKIMPWRQLPILPRLHHSG